MKIYPFSAAVAWACCVLTQPLLGQTADPAASPRTRAVLAYIQGLVTRHDKHVLSGQFLSYAPRASLTLPEAIHRESGKWPAYIGVDYMNFDRKRVDTEAADRVALAYWQQGGLVEVNVHLPNPADPTGRDGGLNDTGVDLKALLAPGTPLNAAWLAELDAIAAGLAELQASGVVVLWRPFHEMNGGWFWWGAKPTADFVAVWRHMFTYFTQTKGLHNLVWIYSPNRGDNAAEYYPGDAYADIVGIDAYTDLVDAEHVKGAAALLKTGKPFGFGEYGPHGASNPPGTFEYPRFAEGLAAHFPEAVFFMAWNEKWSPARNFGSRAFFSDPSIITREDLPPELFK